MARRAYHNRMNRLRQSRAASATTKPSRWIGVVLIGLAIAVCGALKLLAGHAYYRNYWNAPVFAPFVVVIGVLFVAAVVVSVVRERRRH